MSIVTRHFIVKEDGKAAEADIEVYENDDIPSGTEINFLSKEEIVEDLLDRVLNGEDKETVRKETLDELNSLHPSLGSFIRNTYGLWLSPHTYSESRNSSAENYAEKISLEILKNVKQRLA